MGPAPISWQGVLAWQQVRDVTLNAWELDTVMAMDSAAMKIFGEK